MIFTVLKEKGLPTKNAVSAKLPFRCEGDKDIPRPTKAENILLSPDLFYKDILKEILQIHRRRCSKQKENIGKKKVHRISVQKQICAFVSH